MPLARAVTLIDEVLLAMMAPGAKSASSSRYVQVMQAVGKLWAAGRPGTAIRLNVLQGSNMREVDVKSIDRQQYMRSRPSL